MLLVLAMDKILLPSQKFCCERYEMPLELFRRFADAEKVDKLRHVVVSAFLERAKEHEVAVVLVVDEAWRDTAADTNTCAMDVTD